LSESRNGDRGRFPGNWRG